MGVWERIANSTFTPLNEARPLVKRGFFFSGRTDSRSFEGAMKARIKRWRNAISAAVGNKKLSPDASEDKIQQAQILIVHSKPDPFLINGEAWA
tara:strand:- start:190 stop:471 length:282 start_codon:yes stop_codon:yes gene_type:complete